MNDGSPLVTVVGAGAAGLLAARSAALHGARVLLLEKTSRVGTKILISGGGKCNIAHAGRLEEVINSFDKSEAVFLRPSCYRLTNEEIIGFFEERGLRLQARPNGRVFPADGDAKDVLQLLIREVLSLGVRICLNTAVHEVVVTDRSVAGVRVATQLQPRPRSAEPPATGYGAKALLRMALRESSETGEPWDGPEFIECGHLVICCGGSSYPNSGTTGDGYKWMRSLGHSVVKPRAALAPIYLLSPDVELAGVSLEDCRLIARSNGKRMATERGDLLFTHQGVSGPAPLEISRQVALLTEQGETTLEIDLTPEVGFEGLLAGMAKVEGAGNTTLGRWLSGQTRQAIADRILKELNLTGSTALNRVSKKDRNRLAETVKGWRIGTVKTVPLEKGEVTAGGVDLAEIDPKTMRSKLISGLYLAGEILDVSGPVGGYNLQAAFATGHVAGETAASDANSIQPIRTSTSPG